MIPLSNSSNFDRRRQGQSQRRALVRSNSSLLGSIKNFVAAPFARLFIGNPNEYDDPNDITGKRRLIPNQSVDSSHFVEDGPAPAKRMRVQSPQPDLTRGSSGYLDPPGSAFLLGHNSNLSNNIPSRSASLSIPSTTVSDSNARSTISPLRNHFSRNMSIDSIPSRPLSRDITMNSFSSIPDRSVSMGAGSRDSLPPHPFRMRQSMTPQPHTSMLRQPVREASEPPPVTTLHSNPVFVRGPSQTLELPVTQPVATLGSLVESQRSLRSPSRQRSLLFGTSQSSIDPQAVAAERTLHELEFYKTPLVPTRIRSRMPSSIAASTSSSNITDMFARKHSLILMADRDRSNKRDRKKKSKEREVKETNDTKPYAGTTGIKKRLAKAKGVSEEDKAGIAQDQTTAEKAEEALLPPKDSVMPEMPEIPVPPSKEKDTFNVAAFPSSATPAKQSSLRVGRAARSHLSRPIKKFSATYDDDEVTDETKKDLEMLEEVAKKVPTFDIPAGFNFAKDVSSIESTKEPPISTLPFSLTKSDVSAPVPPVQTAAVSKSQPLTESALFGSPAVSPLFGESTTPSRTADTTSVSVEMSDAVGRVPNFFASSKVLTSQPPVTPPMPSLAPSVPSAPIVNPSFSFTPIPEDKREDAPVNSNRSSPSAASVPVVNFGDPRQSSSSSAAPTVEVRKDAAQSSSSFSGPSAATTSQSSLFSFGKQTEPASSPPLSFSFGSVATTPDAPAGNTLETPSFGVAASGPTPSSSVFGKSGKPSGSTLFGTSSDNAKPSRSSLFGASAENSKSTESSLFGASGSKPAGSSPFSASGDAKPAGTSFISGSTDTVQPKGLSSFTFGPSSAAGSVNSSTTAPKLFGSHPTEPGPVKPSFGDGNNSFSSPFSFAPPPSATPETPKLLFGGPATVSDSNRSTGFTFGGSSAPPTSAGSTSPFTFGSGSGSSNSTSTPFAFDVTPARPVTPPNQDQEVRMEESPARDIQVSKPVESRPSLSGFLFNSAPSSSTSLSLFGQNNTPPAPTGFSFGQASSSSNLFGTSKTDDKPAEVKPFGMGQSQTSVGTPSPFSFGRTAENEPPRPSTTGSFSFGGSSASSTNTFAFGAPSNSSAPSNPFGTTQNDSTNTSSTFSQPSSSSFSFAVTPASGSGGSNPFVFGSQPASPATPTAGLPLSGFGSSTSNPFGAQVSSNAGFGAPSTPSAGGSLFTIGAAPSDSGRQIKKLPQRKMKQR